ncbi:MAG: DUF853 domain-containing protein, partial [Ancrocorticia sp.]|nr:DUF853 domain-containing protein [Ancrocorticia sp.]
TVLEAQGGDAFFGMPGFDTADLLRVTDGQGIISLLQAGDITQTPKDIPSDVLAQLGSRIQHALRAATPDDQKKLKQTVATFPATELDLAEVITNLGTGEAVVTVLAPDGRPTPAAPFRLWAPASTMGPATGETLAHIAAASPLLPAYATSVNPQSAEEKLATQAAQREAQKTQAEAQKAEKAAEGAAEKAARQAYAAALAQQERELKAEKRAAQREADRRSKAINSALTSLLRSASSQLGREITRSIFGTRRR